MCPTVPIWRPLGRGGENILPLPGIEQRFLGCPVTLPAEVFRLIIIFSCYNNLTSLRQSHMTTKSMEEKLHYLFIYLFENCLLIYFTYEAWKHAYLLIYNLFRPYTNEAAFWWTRFFFLSRKSLLEHSSWCSAPSAATNQKTSAYNLSFP